VCGKWVCGKWVCGKWVCGKWVCGKWVCAKWARRRMDEGGRRAMKLTLFEPDCT
jgi:hypothetical protein